VRAPRVGGVTPGKHPVRLRIDDDLCRSRLTVLFRLLLVLPHLVWLLGWTFVAQVAAFANWVAVVITGETPAVFHGFLASYVRYTTHVNAYLFLAANPFPGFRGAPGYPVDVELPPPGRQSRWSAGFRLVLAVPAALLASALGTLGGPGGVVTVAAIGSWFAALALGRSPRGLRDLTAYGLGYTAQTLAYLLVITARYPDSHPDRLLDRAAPHHPVRLRLEDELRRSRLTVFFRPLLVFPHLLWLTLWGPFALLATVANWFAALAIARSPRPLHRFLGAYVRYTSHVYAYATLVGNPFPGFTGRESGYPVAILVDPPARQRRLVTLFRLPLALPIIVLSGVLWWLLILVGVFGLVAALVSGRMPAGLRASGAVVIRYGAQVTAYWSILTDRYPDSTPMVRTERAE
jgi:uncharacterized protein DUF4389